jgi:LacI family transcriptional regulator
MSITIRDVARRAGVGLGTVSRVINHSPLVNQETRTRVERAVAELDYVPNPAARGLPRGRTNTIAVVVPFFTRPSIIERLRGVENTLVQTEYDLIVYNVETPSRRDQCIREVPRRGRVDGVLVISLPPRQTDVAYLAKANVPIVLVDAHHPSLDKLNRLVVEDVLGGQRVTEFLIELGHRRIAFVGDVPDSPFNFTSSNDRLHGYRTALRNAHIPFERDYVMQGTHGRVQARELAQVLLRRTERPTAIFAASDTQAMGVLEAARELGLRVPHDLSVVGYDDIEVAEYLGLTTMRQSLYESGKRGVELLLHAIEHPRAKPVVEVLPTELIVRQTTAPPRVA